MSKHDAILAVVAQFAETFGLEHSQITPNATLAGLGIDSLQLIELLFRFEEEFGIQVAMEEFDSQSTVRDAVEKIERLVDLQARVSANGQQ